MLNCTGLRAERFCETGVHERLRFEQHVKEIWAFGIQRRRLECYIERDLKDSLMGDRWNCLSVIIRVREQYGSATALLFVAVLLS